MECEKQLAEMIRAGALRRPTQAIGHYFKGTHASCALGAAYEGMYRLPAETDKVVFRLSRHSEAVSGGRLQKETLPCRGHRSSER